MGCSVPAVLDALDALISAALPDVPVGEGFPLVDSDDVISLGWDAATPDTTGSVQPLQIGGTQLREEYDLPVEILCTGPAGDQLTLRNRAFAYFDAIVTAWRGAGGYGFVDPRIQAYPAFTSYAPMPLNDVENDQRWSATVRLSFHVIAQNG